MKTANVLFVKSLSFIFTVLLFHASFSQIIVESTLDGGVWSDGDSWIGGSPPEISDNVVINGLVILDNNTSCNNFTVSSTGQFRNDGTGPLSLTIFGDVSNYGTITSISYIFNINVHKDILNSGNWQNSHTYFVGGYPQNITTITPFRGTNLISTKSGGQISSSHPLRFTNSMVDLNDDTLYMTSGYDSIFINSGYLKEATIIGINAAKEIYCHHENLPYFEEVIVECDELVIDGIFQFSPHFEVFGNVRVEGTIQNRGLTQQTANIIGNFINNGIVKDFIYGWSLNISGDIFQNGTWTNYYTYLTGDDDQHLSFSQDFEGENFINSNSNGKVISNSKLVFNNTMIDFNYDTLMFVAAVDSLIINGQYLQNAVITKEGNKSSGFLNCTQTNNAYFQDVSIYSDNIELDGTFQFHSPMNFHGNVTVSGIFQNRPTSGYTAYIYGNLTNNGIIQDPVSNCILHITGDITQNGDWLNNQTILDGMSDQSINLVNNHEISGTVYFDALNAGAPYQWYYEGGILNSADFIGETSNSLTWQVPVDPIWYGEFYCQTGAGPSRIITIEGGLLVDISLFLEGPFNGTNMETFLNSNDHIPLSHPYNVSPWNYSGTESVASIPPDIVDWILLELRETSGGPETATSGTIITQHAVFLRDDGFLVKLDGSRNITINVPEINENLYAVVWHRNHLPIMSSASLGLSGDIYIYDFSTTANQAYGDNQNNLDSVFGMIGGDANGDGTINETDGIEQWYPFVGQAGYFGGDVNMDAQVNNKDKNDIWLGNSGKYKILPEE